MTPFNMGMMIGLWVGIYLVIYILLTRKNECNVNKSNFNNSNNPLVKDLLKISNSIDSCMETIIFLEQAEITDHQVRYHDELLTQELLKLDQIDDSDLKPMRKETIRCLQRILDSLEMY